LIAAVLSWAQVSPFCEIQDGREYIVCERTRLHLPRRPFLSSWHTNSSVNPLEENVA
jgi:hypothetical protein